MESVCAKLDRKFNRGLRFDLKILNSMFTELMDNSK